MQSWATMLKCLQISIKCITCKRSRGEVAHSSYYSQLYISHFNYCCLEILSTLRTVHSPTFSAGNSRNPPDSNPGMSWCDKGQIGIFIPGGVRRSPLETSILIRPDFFHWGSPLDSGGIQWNNQTPAESNGITRLWWNPAESSGLQQSLFIVSLFNY